MGILSEARDIEGDIARLTAETIHHATEGGGSSGMIHIVSDEEISRETMKELLESQGSDPAFLLGDDYEQAEGSSENQLPDNYI